MAATLRQKVLTLYLSTSALDSQVLGWAIYDGTGAENFTTGDNTANRLMRPVWTPCRMAGA